VVGNVISRDNEEHGDGQKPQGPIILPRKVHVDEEQQEESSIDNHEESVNWFEEQGHREQVDENSRKDCAMDPDNGSALSIVPLLKFFCR